MTLVKHTYVHSFRGITLNILYIDCSRCHETFWVDQILQAWLSICEGASYTNALSTVYYGLKSIRSMFMRLYVAPVHKRPIYHLRFYIVNTQLSQ